tara:strand:- start:243 stop:740 length:498 start_codon:yes stop_codon:yes gene_type:complete
MSNTIETKIISKYFLILTLINTVAAIFFTLPILIPTSGIPLIVGVFPGTWLLIGYFLFLIVGVIGMLGWSIMYNLMGPMFNRSRTYKKLAIIQLVFIELSIYGVASTISYIGWSGGQALRQGFSIASVGFLIEPYVLPTGVFVSLVLVGQLCGIINIFSTIRMKQ